MAPFYEVSNVKTLGQTERELVELVCKVALQLNRPGEPR